MIKPIDILLFNINYVTWDMYFAIGITISCIVFFIIWFVFDSRENRIFNRMNNMHKHTIYTMNLNKAQIESLDIKTNIRIDSLENKTDYILSIMKATFYQVQNGRTKEFLKNHLRNNDFNSIFAQLEIVTEDKDFLLTTQARYNMYQKTKDRMTTEQKDVELNKIRDSLLTLINQLND